MRVYDIILKKREGEKLDDAAIRCFVKGVTDGSIPDYQAAAFLMAAFLRGLDAEETAALTGAMMESGEVLDLSAISPHTVDKHSTGGIGDKISLVLAPAVAACGGVVPMMSGRGLGHTGGTLDKLESIPGFRVGLSIDEMKAALRNIGVALIGQTGALAPADKKLYALRDVTATVESIPLITASIMSKKFAAGPAGIVMDVKWGSGAFMKSLADARALARSLVSVGRHMGRRVSAFLTDMNQPLGRMAGNALEVRETLECLKGRGPEDVMALTRALAGEMLHICGIAGDNADGEARFDASIADGSALAKFRQIVEIQNGDTAIIDDPDRLPTAAETVFVPAAGGGFVGAMDCTAIGVAVILLGGGREKSEDLIDHAVGIEVLKKIGDPVAPGEPLARLHVTPGRSRVDEALALYRQAVTLVSNAPPLPALIVEKLD
jgi:pyrimidine-nucleoside phosphorylase